MSSTTEELRQKGVELDTDGIRATFNGIVERSGRPLAQVAPETAVAYQTLAAWSKNKYTGNNDRIAKQISAWITTMRARERARLTMRAVPPFTMTKTASRIWEAAEFAQTMPQMALISADSGVGKTTAVEAYAATASNAWVVTTEPVHDQMGALLDLISRALKMEYAHSAAAKSRLIQERLRGTKGLLIVDEAQNLTAVLRDQLRSMVFDGAGVGVLLVGNEKLRLQFSRERMTGENAQLFSRIGLRFTRAKPLKEDVSKLLDAWGVDDDKAREAALGIAMKPGANRVMSNVLVLAFSLADARGDEAPTLEDVEMAWQQLGGNA